MRDHDKRVRTVLSLLHGGFLILANPPGLAHENTAQMDAIAQSKLSPTASSHHEVVHSTDTTATIVIDGMHETVSMEWLTIAAVATNAPPLRHQQTKSPSTSTSKNTPARETETQKFVVDRLVSK